MKEPVAWMQMFEDGEDRRMSLDFERIGINDIPLYTAPQGDGDVCGGCGAIRYDPICEPVPRELSDDVVKELIDCLQEAVDGMGGAYAIWAPKARAILKKASEK